MPDPLTDNQRGRARYYGGKEYATRKRQASTVESGLRAIVAGVRGEDRADQTSTLAADELRGLLTDAELRTLAAAACIVGKAAAHLGACAREAERIKADYQKRCEDALRVMRALPHSTIEDGIALCGAAYRTPLHSYEVDDLRRTVEQGWSVAGWLKNKVQSAIAELAADCARDAAAPTHRAAEIAARLPGLKRTHATLIAEIKALAVRQRIEETA